VTNAAPQPSFLATRRGKLTLALLAAIAFLDFVDASITNIALPSIRRDLGFSGESLVWVPSAYLLTYGGFMLLGGRAADLLGRRRVLVTGIVVIGLSSLVGGLAQSEAVLIGARLVQGLGAAMTLPAALSILTTSFKEGSDRNTALGVWGGVAGLASAVGVLLGGIFTEGPGWRWVMFVNPVAAALVLGPVFWLVSGERRRMELRGFDVRGAVLATTGMLLMIYALVKAPDVGWGTVRTIGELAGALVLLGAFVVNELRVKNPLAPLSIFRINGLGYSNATQLVAFAGFLAVFFFLTLYMQNVLGYSPIQAGAAYLPLTFAVGVAAGISSQLIARIGTRPLIVGGALVAAGGLYWLSRIPVGGSFAADLLPGMLVLSVGAAAVFVAVTTAANAGVPADKAGLAAALLNSSQQVGGALGLAILTALATSRTNSLLAANASVPDALTGGFQRGLLAGSVLLAAAAVVGLRATNTRGEQPQQISAEGASPAGGPELAAAPGRAGA
jgi:EmrB/QacA subfamily drug resistance transporter